MMAHIESEKNEKFPLEALFDRSSGGKHGSPSHTLLYHTRWNITNDPIRPAKISLRFGPFHDLARENLLHKYGQ